MPTAERSSGPQRPAWILGPWLACHLILILGHVALVFTYATFVAPGQPSETYQLFARASAPWFAILASGPLFYLLGRLLRRRWSSEARTLGLWIWGLYCVADMAALLVMEGIPGPLLAGQWVVSQTVKLVALWIGTREP